MLFRNTRRPRSQGFGLIELLVVIGIFVMLIGLMLPALVQVGGAAARTQSTNNLKNIGLAFHSFHDANRRLPFNGSDTAVGATKYSAKAESQNPISGSWAFQILPYIEQAPLFKSLDRTKGVPTFMDPARGRPAVETSNGGGAWTDYFLNGYLNDPGKPNAADRKRTLISVIDGNSNTVFVGHGNINTKQYQAAADVTLSTNIFLGGTSGTVRSGDAKDSDPTGVTLQRDSDKAPGVGSWGGPLPQGALMGMGDATVRTFPYATKNFGAFLTPSGGEVVTLPDE